MGDYESEPLLDVPIGIDAVGWRTDHDTLGPVDVPADRYWGPQTQRSLRHFGIGTERMPIEVIHAYGHIKRAAARANGHAGLLPAAKIQAIVRASDEVAEGLLDEHFPLLVFQTGSGTHTNANVNEVIANRGNQFLRGEIGRYHPLHPNDDVNMSQSSNDTFVTAMHVATVGLGMRRTLPALVALADAVEAKAGEWSQVVKIGRTHLMDATPITVGQEWSGYAAAIRAVTDHLARAMDGLLPVALGGTAVGTGLNTPRDFAMQATGHLAGSTGFAFAPAENPFAAQATLDPMVRAHAALKAVAVTLFKIANDLRWLGSGPRSGLQELLLPANEPGSTIMPGKVNPTQAEAMLMVCIQVIGLDTAVAMAGAEGNFELNAFRPIVISNTLTSARLLADTCDNLRRFLVDGARLNEPQLTANIGRSVMLVTALVPAIGYERAAQIAHHAFEQDLTLREAALDMGIEPDLFDRLVDPAAATRRPNGWNG